jgi:hypothetical protein
LTRGLNSTVGDLAQFGLSVLVERVPKRGCVLLGDVYQISTTRHWGSRHVTSLPKDYT